MTIPGLLERSSSQAETTLKIFEHASKGLGIAQAAIEDVMGNRPTIDHHQSSSSLPVLDPAVSTEADPLSITSTDKVALQPLCQARARYRGAAEAIGHQYQHSICQREPTAFFAHAFIFSCSWRPPLQLFFFEAAQLILSTNV